MIVNDLNILRTRFCPDKTDSPLVVDANTVLPLSIARKCLEPVTRRCAQEVQRCCGMQLSKFSFSYGSECTKPSRVCAFKQGLRILAVEGQDHEQSYYAVRNIAIVRSAQESALKIRSEI